MKDLRLGFVLSAIVAALTAAVLTIPSTSADPAAGVPGSAPPPPAVPPAAAGVPAPLAGTVPLTLTILHTNDVHAHVDEWAAAGITVGGAARLATEIRRVRATEDNVLLLDAGDQFLGTLFYTVYKSDVITSTMNALGYDAMAVGNHEFDDGPAELARFVDGAAFPVLSANIAVGPASPLAGKIAPTVVVTVSGQPIGLVGLTTPDTAELSSPGEDITFGDPAAAARAAVADLAARGVDKIVALTHLGYDRDLALARAVPGIDVIVGGHSHTYLHTPPDAAAGPYPTVVTGTGGAPTLVVSAGEWGRYVGRLRVSFTGDGVVASFAGNPVELDASVAKDPTLEAIVAAHRGQLEAFRHEVVGESRVEMPVVVGTDRVCRIGECLIGDLVAEAVLFRADDDQPDDADAFDFAIVNGGGLRAPLPAGPVTVGDVMEALPFGNTLSTFAITGTHVLEALENGVSRYPEQAGRFPQVAGLRFQWRPEQPPGARITSTEIWDWHRGQFVALESDRVYRVATNDFVRRGGDGYAVFRDLAIDAYDFGPPLDQVLIDHIRAHSPVAPALDGRIQHTQWTVCLPLALDRGMPYAAGAMSDEEYAVLRGVIEHEWSADRATWLERFVIGDRAGMPLGDEAPDCGALVADLPGLDAAACRDFAARNARPTRLEDRFGLSMPVVLIGEAEIEEIFRRGGGWEGFRRRYPNAQGIMELARPGFSPDGRQALAYIGNQIDYLAGRGYLYLLTSDGNAWKVVSKRRIWVS